jgi:hypothetical protein
VPADGLGQRYASRLETTRVVGTRVVCSGATDRGRVVVGSRRHGRYGTGITGVVL